MDVNQKKKKHLKHESCKIFSKEGGRNINVQTPIKKIR